MVVGGEHERVIGCERITLGDQLDRCARIGGEADRVVFHGSVEVLQHHRARLIYPAGALARRGVLGVRVPQDRTRQQCRMGSNLAFGVERTPGVVEVSVPSSVETREFVHPQLREECVVANTDFGHGRGEAG